MMDVYPMSQFASKNDRKAAINRDIDALAKKRDYAADVMGNPMLALSYQQDIDKLIDLLLAKTAHATPRKSRIFGTANLAIPKTPCKSTR